MTRQKRKSDQGSMSLEETDWKILTNILRKGLSHSLLVSLREEFHTLRFPMCLDFS